VARRRERRCVGILGEKKPQEKDHLEDLGVDGTLILKLKL